MELVSRIGRELQSRYTFDQINDFLGAYKVRGPEKLAYNSKWRYVREALQQVDNGVVLKIAEDLDLDVHEAQVSLAVPRNWSNTTAFRLFVSHVSQDKHKALRLKYCLAPYAIHAFVAHEDIHPTAEWQKEIERALYAMNAFLAIHTPGFSESYWTQQEVGFALGRGTKVISFKMGEDPTGFIAKHQALSRQNRTAEEIAKEVNEILASDERTSPKLLAAQKAKSPNEIPF